MYAYEALVRGVDNEPAGVILSQVTEENRYAFDQACRVMALTLATKLGLPKTGAKLSSNFMPGAVYSSAACIQLPLKTALSLSSPWIVSSSRLLRPKKFRIAAPCSNCSGVLPSRLSYGTRRFRCGVFGTESLADFIPDILKLDMDLTRNIHQRPAVLTAVGAMVKLAASLSSLVVAEGIESVDEYEALRKCGIRLMQGYLFARPGFESLPRFTIPTIQNGEGLLGAPAPLSHTQLLIL